MKIFRKDYTRLTPEFRKILFNPRLWQIAQTIWSYCRAQKISIDEQEKEKLIQTVENTIYNHVFYFAHLIYTRMELSGNWGDAGEQQVKISFCRNLLNIDPEAQISSMDAFLFMNRIEENKRKLNLDTLKLEDVMSIFESYKFKILDEDFSAYHIAELNNVLGYLGSLKVLQGGFYGDDQEYILGTGRRSQQGEYSIMYLDKELIRTPNNITAMAAVIGEKEIFLRRESLATIFVQKWGSVFESSGNDDLRRDIYRNISEGIKQKTLALYGVKAPHELPKIKEDFLADMGETILYHEIGHGIIQHEILSPEASALGEATRIFGENIYTAFHEILAEIAPRQGDLRGALLNMASVAKKDYRRGERMFYMYLSDTWFFDTQDEYMYLYSELMAIVLLKFLDSSGHVLFDQLEHELVWKRKKAKSLLDKIVQWFGEDLNELQYICKSAIYIIKGEKRNFNWIKTEVEREIRKNKPKHKKIVRNSQNFWAPFWNQVFSYLKKYSKAGDDVQEFLNAQHKKIFRKMFSYCVGKSEAAVMNYDGKAWAVKKLKELEILAINSKWLI